MTVEGDNLTSTWYNVCPHLGCAVVCPLSLSCLHLLRLSAATMHYQSHQINQVSNFDVQDT